MQEDYRKQLFEDCQKELQDEISHHKNYKNKYGKVRRICHTTSTINDWCHSSHFVIKRSDSFSE